MHLELYLLLNQRRKEERLAHISRIPVVIEFIELVSVSGNLIFVLSVLRSLVAVPETLVEDFDGGAAIETVLHLPEGVDNESSKEVAGIASEPCGLCLKSFADQCSKVRQNVLCGCR